MTMATTMVAKTTCFPDDIWSQIKGFLFESNLKCAWCKHEIPNGTHKLIKHIKPAKSLINSHTEEDAVGVINKKTGKYFSCFAYTDIKSNDILPFSNLEDYYTFKKARVVNLWYCKICWSNHIFKPYTIKKKIQTHYSLNYSQTEKICMKLMDLFNLSDDSCDYNGITIFDKQRLKKTRERYDTYIRFMEEYYKDEYKSSKTKFDRRLIIGERQLKNDFKIYVKNVYLSRVYELHKELALYQISKQFKTGKISYNVFRKLINIPDNKSYSERHLIAFGRDIYD